MVEMTALDIAHAAMMAAGEAGTGGGDTGDDTARLQFYERLADTQLFVLLDQEPEGDAISPALFEVADGRFVLAFDGEDRLAQFADRAVPYAALSGRVLAQMLAGQEIGLGVNLEVAPSAILIPQEAVMWLNQTLDNAPALIEARLTGLAAPSGLPEALIVALRSKFASAIGLAQAAYLVAVQYEGGGQGHLLGFIGVSDRAQDALAKAAGEALTFTGIEAGEMDVGFFAPADPMVENLARVGLYFEMPQPEERTVPAPVAPGSDPAKPPILR